MTPTALLDSSSETALIKQILDKDVQKKERSKYSPEREVFILSFKKGHEVIKYHFQDDSLKAAVETGQKFCAKNRYRFIVVTPLLRDLKNLGESEEVL